MKFFTKRKDGGPDSTVTGYWLVEIKSLFSIALLRFDHGTRENFHSHAFNSCSWLLSGTLIEQVLIGPPRKLAVFGIFSDVHWPSIKPIITKRSNFHRVCSHGTSWALTLRGPWIKQWLEYNAEEGRFYWLENGRKIVREEAEQ